jgi:thioredoxin reductase/Fe-S-cluster-containing hydrogenase component 2
MLETEIAIVGAGPAGLTAACEAAQVGSKVMVFDENNHPGGQLMKQIHKFFGSKEHLAGVRGLDIGKKLFDKALSLGVDVRLNTVVWGYFENQLAVVFNNQVEMVKAEKIIVAAGAYENILSFPGWTLPGVMGAGGAQTMMNLYRVLPGKKILMIGAGNVGLIVTYQLLQAGAEVVAVVEVEPKIGGYQVHSAKIRRAGVPILTSFTIREALGKDRVEKAVITQVGEDFATITNTEQELEVDTICLSVGLTPLTELLRLIGCEMKYVSALGGYIPVHNRNMETSISGVYVAGDVAGIEEASIAMEEGRIAGTAAAESLGHVTARKARDIKMRAEVNLSQLRLDSSFTLPSNKKTEEKNREEKNREEKNREEKNREEKNNLSKFLNGNNSVPVIECYERIPCNPCEDACPFGCIQIGTPITNLPIVNFDKCTGCGQCVMACPGLAIFLVEQNYSATKAAVTFPYEFLPLPEKGEKVIALDRNGSKVSEGEVLRVTSTKKGDRTPLVKIAIPKEFANDVRHIIRK